MLLYVDGMITGIEYKQRAQQHDAYPPSWGSISKGKS